jgi:uncharacterized protein
MNFSNKVVLITGASSGIGRETARMLAARGSLVVVVARRTARLEELAAQITNLGGRALAITADVSSQYDVDRLFQRLLDQCGRLDVLVNNAGTGLYATIQETTTDQMENIWRTNFMSTFYCIRRAIPLLQCSSNPHVITVSSLAGVRGTPMMGAYCATKFAQIGLMDSLRRELKEIHSTIVLPGATQTEFVQAMENPAQRKIKPRGKIVDASQVAEAIVEAIEHPRSRVITQKFGRSLILLNAFSPDLTDWLIGLTQRRKDAE